MLMRPDIKKLSIAMAELQVLLSSSLRPSIQDALSKPMLGWAQRGVVISLGLQSPRVPSMPRS